MFNTTVVGRDSSDVIAKLNQDIDRARMTRTLVENLTPTDHPTILSVRYADNGGISMEVKPIGKERQLYSALVRWYDSLARFFHHTCAMCDKPRQPGRSYCSEECHTAWRVRDAERRGYVLYD